MNTQKLLYSLLLVILLSLKGSLSPVQAGNFPKGTGFEAKIQYGFIIRHHLDMGLYTNRRFTAAELNLTFQTSGEKMWHQAYKLPEYGISYFYSGLGQTMYIGQVHAIFPWVRFPLLSGGNYHFSLRVGLGAGYLDRHFDRIDNYKNLSIGSHVNSAIQFHFESRLKLSEKLFFTGGFSFTHFSNGVTKSPDYGLNLPMLTVGLLYFPNPRHYEKWTDELPALNKSWDVRLSFQNGTKQIQPLLGPHYLVLAFSGDFVRIVSHKSRLGLGADVFFDTSDKANLEQDGDTISNILAITKPGVKGIYELDLGRLRMDFEVGVYLYGRDHGDGFLYDKLGLKYYVSKSVFLSFALKSHYAKADYVAWGLGYTIPFNL